LDGGIFCTSARAYFIIEAISTLLRTLHGLLKSGTLSKDKAVLVVGKLTQLLKIFPKRRLLLRVLSLDVLLKKIDLGAWLSSLLLVSDAAGGRPKQPLRKGKLITMPPAIYRTRRLQSAAIEQSCEDSMLRSL
jgi:hypothetical protein